MSTELYFQNLAYIFYLIHGNPSRHEKSFLPENFNWKKVIDGNSKYIIRISRDIIFLFYNIIFCSMHTCSCILEMGNVGQASMKPITFSVMGRVSHVSRQLTDWTTP